jgi:hypothetical protein
MDLEVANDADRGEAGTELGSSDTPKIVEKSDREARIKLKNLGATSQFRKKSGRAGKKSRVRSRLGLSNNFATQCGMHSQVDEETLVEFTDGTRVPSTSF